jgi:hypothetical protein
MLYKKIVLVSGYVLQFILKYQTCNIIKIMAGITKWEKDTKLCIKKGLQKYTKTLNSLEKQDATEADTRIIVVDMLSELFGYDKYLDLSAETMIRGQFADLVIKIDGQPLIIVEIKRIGVKLNKNHIIQAQTYAVNDGIDYIILTNGQDWKLYKIVNKTPMEVHELINVNVLAENRNISKMADWLFYISKKSFEKKQIDNLWKIKTSTSPSEILNSLFSDKTIDALRRDLQNRTKYFKITNNEIRKILKENIIKKDL